VGIGDCYAGDSYVIEGLDTEYTELECEVTATAPAEQ
jgi:hypothetical protein